LYQTLSATIKDSTKFQHDFGNVDTRKNYNL